MTDLPVGWALATVEETVAHTIGGVWGLSAGEADVEVRVIRVTELKTFGRLEPSTAARRSVTASQLSARSLQPDDLLLEKSGGGPNTPVGRVGMVTQVVEATVCSNFMQLLRPNPTIAAPRFLMWQLVYAHVSGVTAGLQTATTNIRNLKMKEYWALPVVVPPIAEQERIVTAIEEAFSKLDAGEAGLRATRQRLKRLRESVLAAAVTGRLVPQDPTDEPASKLLANLGTVPAASSDEPLGLPSAWNWVLLGNLARMSLGKMLDAKQQTGLNPIPLS